MNALRAPVGILCAMPQEQALLVAAMGDALLLPGSGLEARRGRLDGREVVVAAAGVGKVHAATTATLLVERLGCRALVLSGVAGGLSAELGIADLIIATRVVDIDYGRITDAGRVIYQPGTPPLPGTRPDPGYRLPADLERRVRVRAADAGIAVAFGTIVCGDAFLASAACARSWPRHGRPWPSRWRGRQCAAWPNGSASPGSSYAR